MLSQVAINLYGKGTGARSEEFASIAITDFEVLMDQYEHSLDLQLHLAAMTLDDRTPAGDMHPGIIASPASGNLLAVKLEMYDKCEVE